MSELEASLGKKIGSGSSAAAAARPSEGSSGTAGGVLV
jgi:hypothetical protein